MNDLITITKQTINNEDINSVSARELHKFLENTDNVNTWFKRQADRAMLEEGADYERVAILQTSGQTATDYAISLSGAKEIAMLNGGEKGKQARQYFIECEKRLKEQNKFKVPQTFKEALLLAVEQQEVIEQLENKIKQDAPLVSFGNAIATSSDSILIGDLAKVSGKTGRNNLFKKLKEANILCKNNLPRQQYIDSGYFEVTERVVKSVKGDLNTFTTHVTGKGQIWLLSKIDEFLLKD